MKIKTIITVIVISLVLGICIGWLIFKKNTANSAVGSVEAEPQIWTCSMDPQIRQNEAGDCAICGMDLIILDGAASSSESFGFQMTEEAISLSNIHTVVIGDKQKNKFLPIKLNGKIQSDETNTASLVSHIPGRIEKLYIRFTGEQVKEGQRIASIYSPELITAQKELIEAKKIMDINPGLYEAAKNKLKYWKINSETIENISKSEKLREEFDIYADYSGIVSKRKVSVGDHLTMGKVLFDVQNLNSVWALFEVYEDDLQKVKVGDQVSFTTPSIPNKTFKATLTFIDPVINPQTRVASVRAEVNNSNNELKPEMFLTAFIKTKSSKSNTLSVPKTAVLWTGQRSVVYVKVPNMDIPSFEYREIELGQSTDGGYQVLSGLKDGEEVVTNGAFVIDASSQLNNQTSMMNKKIASAEKEEILSDYTSDTPKSFKEQLSQLTNAYLKLKNALVETDSKNANSSIATVLNSLKKINSDLLNEEAYDFWQEQLHIMESHANEMKTSKDVEEQRNQFYHFSNALIKSVKSLGVWGSTFYVQYCPMANQDKGAYWLSAEHYIKNPYFGDKMLKCGMVKDTINNTFKNPSMNY